MALLPMGSATDQPTTQESMFEEPASLPGLQAYEPEVAYEAADEFYQEIQQEAADSDADDLRELAALETEAREAVVLVQHEDAADSQTDTAEAANPSAETPAPADPEPAPEPASELSSEPDSLAVLTVDDFAALEERVLRAVTLVRSERKARVAAEERAVALETQYKAELEAQIQAQHPTIERLQREVDSLRVEREQVRLRVERLLGQLRARLDYATIDDVMAGGLHEYVDALQGAINEIGTAIHKQFFEV